MDPQPAIAPTRRSRMRRQPSGKRVELTPRDIEIFRLLARYRYLRSTFLRAFVGGASETRFKERLGHLYHEGGYLNRPREQWQAVNARYQPAVYELEEKGEAILHGAGWKDHTIPGISRQSRAGSNRHFAHGLMICEAHASIELGVRASRGARFITWPEILAKAPEETRRAPTPLALPVHVSYTPARSGTVQRVQFDLLPDGLFGLEYTRDDGGKTYRFFALEAERMNRVDSKNLTQTSWLKKVLAYRDVVARGTHRARLGIPNLLVLAVSPTQAHVDAMKKVVFEVTHGRGSALFLFRATPAFRGLEAASPAPGLYADSWERAGHEPFFICQV